MANNLVFCGYSMSAAFAEARLSFLSEPEDRLKLSFPMLIPPCYPSANIFMLLLATVENRSYTYIWKGLRLVECGLKMLINIPELGRLD